ncbi:hypothetical protein C7C45_18320 [Micromonospora arborensis]|uniref:Lipoprotein LpqB beta-propeller domain-containing protein n=1 Tax=Micromonospora arborensis TaxID=2116518 RepID=A0A318NHP4_9ACTN|nr:hypothetical protein [Micromonospora arborensis]PYC68918.1 hypothetical protein C7C45_18320 [Micromonospora arborensis]
MNLGPLTQPARLAAPACRSRVLVGTAALLFMAVGVTACGPSGPDRASAPAENGNAVPATSDTSVGGGGGSGSGAAPVTAAPASSPVGPAVGSSQWPQLTWYTAQEYGAAKNAPARVSRRTSDGSWQLVRAGRPGNGTAAGQIAVAPDGRRAAWVEASAKRLVISDFDGTKQRTIPTQGQQTCAPSWLDSDRVLFGLGREKDWTIVAINADGTGRKVVATRQASCPTVSGGWIAQFTDRAVHVRDERGGPRTISPRIPSGLVIDGVAGTSRDGRSLVISTHVPNAGECGCGWRFRTYRVDAASGKATELTPLDRAWNEPTGHGQAIEAVALADGGLVVQVNTATPADDAPAYRLVRYAADGRVLASTAVPAGQPWGGLLG